MAGFSGIKAIKDSMQSDGKFWHSSFRKVISNATTAGIWSDLSYSPGNPPANFYAAEPAVAAVLTSTKGIDHGGNVSPARKFVKKLLVYSQSTGFQSCTLMLCDYLLYYPFIDGDSTTEQLLDNAEFQLTRSTTGAGVRAMLVSQGSYAGGGTVSITYTNQDGTPGRISPTVTTNTANIAASIINSGTHVGGSGPFLPLQSGDTGIRSVQSITFTIANGGIIAIVLVKPIYEIGIEEVTATFNTPSQLENFSDSFSGNTIEDGAYLNFICLPNGSVAAGVLTGLLVTTWR